MSSESVKLETFEAVSAVAKRCRQAWLCIDTGLRIIRLPTEAACLRVNYVQLIDAGFAFSTWTGGACDEYLDCAVPNLKGGDK